MSYHPPTHWRLRQQRYQLIGSVCQSCGRPLFPPGYPCCQPRPAASSGLELVWRGKPTDWDEFWINGVEYAAQAY
ncbi:MAG: zinc ribbon domain-containing protein [Anaerolineales bacterium]